MNIPTGVFNIPKIEHDQGYQGITGLAYDFFSNNVFFQKQPLIAKFGEALMAALLIPYIFEIVSGGLMPLV